MIPQLTLCLKMKLTKKIKIQILQQELRNKIILQQSKQMLGLNILYSLMNQLCQLQQRVCNIIRLDNIWTQLLNQFKKNFKFLQKVLRIIFLDIQQLETIISANTQKLKKISIEVKFKLNMQVKCLVNYNIFFLIHKDTNNQIYSNIYIINQISQLQQYNPLSQTNIWFQHHFKQLFLTSFLISLQEVFLQIKILHLKVFFLLNSQILFYITTQTKSIQLFTALTLQNNNYPIRLKHMFKVYNIQKPKINF
ncbi:hypothetical protein TTHERM_000763009 (macronuclear) [Tetrahymena thermophila SB210]|uniref:Uncharacterized protein n=1 Tax=Tetrahymena thermophila (strain SB210) TaxID=312017 RepID=W7X5H2_TETTS|nr:hypothetical protein TTHERM_000763009 [Tetrahymena thermophila SB210]EWS71608.1 hypothetical protein TTHERM_000763009 [Tetrahymena thermophila SB210]|eukprot:XP_012655853.1 hypothetical protein TTHERM_000763009 [Tetrahymena thermophila SB210]